MDPQRNGGEGAGGNNQPINRYIVQHPDDDEVEEVPAAPLPAAAANLRARAPRQPDRRDMDLTDLVTDLANNEQVTNVIHEDPRFQRLRETGYGGYLAGLPGSSSQGPPRPPPIQDSFERSSDGPDSGNYGRNNFGGNYFGRNNSGGNFGGDFGGGSQSTGTEKRWYEPITEFVESVSSSRWFFVAGVVAAVVLTVVLKRPVRF